MRWFDVDGGESVGPGVTLHEAQSKLCGCDCKTLGRTLWNERRDNPIIKNASTLKSIGI